MELAIRDVVRPFHTDIQRVVIRWEADRTLLLLLLQFVSLGSSRLPAGKIYTFSTNVGEDKSF